MSSKVSKDEVIFDLRRVAEELGRPPKIDEYREYGTYSPPTVTRHFDGGFAAARDAVLDCGDGRLPEIPRDDLLDDIKCVAETVGREPSKDDYKEHGEHALSTITYRFESWVAAKREAGVYEGLDDGPTREELLADLRRVDEEYEVPVTQTLYNECGEWTERPIKSRFDSWETACQKAGVDRPDMGPRVEETAAFFEDICRVAEEIQHVPSRTEYHEYGKFSRGMAISRVGSWPEALRRAGFEPRDPGGQPGELNSNWKGGYEPYYGKNWYEQRKATRERDGYECADCGMTDEEHKSDFGWELEVHHITPLREFDNPEDANQLENLITLCRPHHREYEMRDD